MSAPVSGRHPARQTQAAAAATAFVSAAYYALPDEAVAELIELKAGQVPHWARKWLVDIPAMREQAIDTLGLASTLNPAEREQLVNRSLASVGNAPNPQPPDWIAELRTLDSLPPDQLRKDLRDRVDADYLSTYCAESLVNDELMLAPLSADPFQETADHFVRRAEAHYMARRLRLVEIGRAAGFATNVPRPTTALHGHMRWLIEFQINKKSPREINKSDGRHPDSTRTVNITIRRLAKLIGLKLRPTGPIGRPRTRIPKHTTRTAHE